MGGAIVPAISVKMGTIPANNNFVGACNNNFVGEQICLQSQSYIGQYMSAILVQK